MEEGLPSDEEILKGPSPILKHRSENRVTSDLKKEAIKGCGVQLEALSACSKDRLFSVVWVCRSQNKAVTDCLTEFSKNDELRDLLRRRHAKAYPGSVVGWKEEELGSAGA